MQRLYCYNIMCKDDGMKKKLYFVCVVFVTFVQISGEMFTNFYTNKNK